MKKHTYRAVKVKQVDVNRLRQEIGGEEIVFGVDVGKEKMYGAVMTSAREVLVTVKWESPWENKDVAEWLTSLGSSEVSVAMEPSGSYGDAFRHQVTAAGMRVYRVSAKRSHDAAEVYDGVSSWHDAKSAGIVAKLHIDGASEVWLERTEAERKLGAALSLVQMYDEQYHRGLNRLEGMLARYWPEVTHHLELATVTLLSLLSKYGGPGELAAHESEAGALMRRVGGQFLKEEKIAAVLLSARETSGADQIEAELRLVRETAADAMRAYRQREGLRREIERLTEAMEPVRLMSRVTGRVTAAVLYYELGDPRRYPSSAAYLKAAGLNLKERSSGKHIGQLKISKRGSGKVRRYSYLTVLRLLQSDAVFKRWYERKVARDGGVKRKALVGMMRKLLRGLRASVLSGNAFDSRLLFDVRRLKLAV